MGGDLVTTSRVPALLDYLVNAFTGAATLGNATPPVSVFDGPAVTDALAPLALHVGVDDAFSDGAPTSATSEQERQGLANNRQETVTIHCAAVAWDGSDDMRAVRASAFAILAAAEDLIRTNADGFGGNAAGAVPGVSGIALQQNATAQGVVAQVSFTVTFLSFIGS